MPISADQFHGKDVLAGVLKALLTQIERGMSFEHARGAFRDIAMQFGFSPHAPVIKNGNYFLYIAWRTRRLKEIDDLVEQEYLPLSSPDPERTLTWEDDTKPRFSSDDD